VEYSYAVSFAVNGVTALADVF